MKKHEGGGPLPIIPGVLIHFLPIVCCLSRFIRWCRPCPPCCPRSPHRPCGWLSPPHHSPFPPCEQLLVAVVGGTVVAVVRRWRYSRAWMSSRRERGRQRVLLGVLSLSLAPSPTLRAEARSGGCSVSCVVVGMRVTWQICSHAIRCLLLMQCGIGVGGC